MSAASGRFGTPIPASLQGRDRKVLSDGDAPAVRSMPSKAGRKCVDITSSTGVKGGPMSLVAR